jgi:guanylate kinase
VQVAGRTVSRRGCLFIVSGPSGAGKTSICAPAIAKLQGLEISVSVTTRAPRNGEIDGVAYHFVGSQRFEEMKKQGAFAEWAEVHGSRYGTPRDTIDRAIAEGRDLLLDIDVQGAQQLKAAYPEAVSVFLLPPSPEHLERRLRARGTDDSAAVRNRLANACGEVRALPSYDYLIVNEDLGAALDAFLSIVRAERIRMSRLAPEEKSRIVQAFDHHA